MIKVHEVEKEIKKICKNSFDFEKFNETLAEEKILKYLEKIKANFHHIEYEIKNDNVKLLLYTSIDDGYDLSFKMTRVEKSTQSENH